MDDYLKRIGIFDEDENDDCPWSEAIDSVAEAWRDAIDEEILKVLSREAEDVKVQ